MQRHSEHTEVHVTYHRVGFESPVGHRVRTRMEAVVCEWLLKHGIVHRHASEMFTVRAGPTSIPVVYVPDIILQSDKDGRTVIIELLLTFAPKVATRVLVAFRKQSRGEYYVIAVAKEQYLTRVQKEAYDTIIDFDKLDDLLAEIPVPL